MNGDAMVLRAILRLARRREAADESAIALRVASSRREVRISLRRLAACGLVERSHTGTARLSLAGLAVAIAMLPRENASAGRQTRRTSRAA
jgi:Mn-dependent DtxR family transcriptional regulator